MGRTFISCDNSAVQHTNGYSPYEVMFGRKPTDAMANLTKEPEEKTQTMYLDKLQKDMTKVMKMVTLNQEKARKTDKETYDKKAAGSCFEVGDQVLLYNPAVKLVDSRKFHPNYNGPYKITSQEGATNFKIKLIDETSDLKEQIIHQNRLKRSYSQPKVKIDSNITLKNEETSDSDEEYIWIEEQRNVNTEHRIPPENSKLETEKIESDKEETLNIVTSTPKDDRIDNKSTLKSDIITKQRESQEKEDT